jgi:3-oxoacyl-[acyl-carrier protein] reductase
MGTLGLTRAMAVELGPHNILVNHVVPGGWDLTAEAIEDIQPGARAAQIPLGRPGLPQELANVYAFLASDDASYVSGQTLYVNGGEVRY